MDHHISSLIEKAYSSFNSRDIDNALTTFHPEVEWPKAFEGGYISGHDAIRDYWTRQWSEIDPVVEPKQIEERTDGKVEVSIHQIVKDLKGIVLFDGMVKHIYSLQDNLLRKMDIESA